MILKLGTIPQMKKPLEINHLKRYQEISNKASNVASRSELGRLPLIINIYKTSFITYCIFCVKTSSLGNDLRTNLLSNHADVT